jgi:selenocysteine lyase/cysteine desulfurase
VAVQRDWHRPTEGFAAFEDGTVNYLGLPAIEIGLDHVESIGIDTIHERVACLGAWLLEQLQALRHGDGRPAVEIYGPKSWTGRGGTIAFNFLHPSGRWVDERYVDLVAERHMVSVRTGCSCNPGSGELAFSIDRDTLIGGEFDAALILDEYIRATGLPSGGAVRASLGLASNFPGRLPLRRVRALVPRRHRGGRPRRPAAPARLLTVSASRAGSRARARPTRRRRRRA